MLCEFCGRNEADYQFIWIDGAENGEVYLCEKCVREIFPWYKNVLLGFRQTVRPHREAEEQQTASPERFPQYAEARFQRRRLLNELRFQLRNAVDQEDYETAARLRDRIAETEREAGGRIEQPR